MKPIGQIMNLNDIILRQNTPIPWSEGEKIPWNDPGFSQRMLLEHLSQEHDAASRRITTIDKHVSWIHHSVLAGKPAKILDLGCGPGLYAQRIARLGHECVGVDFSPASITYARKATQTEQLSCAFIEQDIRLADYGNGHNLVMLIFGEFNVFRSGDARLILQKAHQALAANGQILLEPHTFSAVRAIGNQPRSWYSSNSGLFSDRPHLCLMENFWDPQQQVTTERYYIVDSLTNQVTRYASSMQAYTNEQYRLLLEECGFGDITFYPSLSGEVDGASKELLAIVGQKSSVGV